MSTTLSVLQELDHETPAGRFSPKTEENIIALALDQPAFIGAAMGFMKAEMFGRNETMYLMAHIINYYEKYGTVPTRDWLLDKLEHDPKFNIDVFDEETILGIVRRKSDPRDVPAIKDQILEWAREQAYGRLYSDEARAAYHRGDHVYLDNIINDAQKITDIGTSGLWLLDEIDVLFAPQSNIHCTTGFSRLDRILNNGGPSPKEVVCWMAPTNVGKCLTVDTKIVEESLSRIYELELEDGQVVKLRGSRRVQTARGTVKVCDLTNSDDLIEIPTGDDTWDLEVPDMRI